MNIAVNKQKPDGAVAGRKAASKNGRGRIRIGMIAASFVAAVAVFAVLVQTEKKILSPLEKEVVYVAAVTIPKGVTITEEKMDNYIIAVEWDKACVPETYVTDKSWFCEKSALLGIDRGVLLTQGLFRDSDEVTGQMKEPVIAGLKADDLSQVTGGILRAGDRIHIFCRTDEEVKEVRRDVTIAQVFDRTGNVISNEDTTSVAERFNVYLDKGEVEQFFQKLGEGSIQVVKQTD